MTDSSLLLYGPPEPRIFAAVEDESLWTGLNTLQQEALLDLARADRIGFSRTIRAHAERRGEAFAFVENTFVSLEMAGLIRPATVAADPVDSTWNLNSLGVATYRASGEW